VGKALGQLEFEDLELVESANNRSHQANDGFNTGTVTFFRLQFFLHTAKNEELKEGL
jgi:hypothetical protein